MRLLEAGWWGVKRHLLVGLTCLLLLLAAALSVLSMVRRSVRPLLPGGATESAALSPEAASLARTAREHLNRAREAQRADDWARYGEEIRALDETLRELEKLLP